MLRDASTSTGTTMSPALAGGSRMIGRHANRKTVTSDSARRAVSAPRCSGDSGTKGRL
jgi:hypothetical protein